MRSLDKNVISQQIRAQQLPDKLTAAMSWLLRQKGILSVAFEEVQKMKNAKRYRIGRRQKRSVTDRWLD